jgi:hypothetical protein
MPYCARFPVLGINDINPVAYRSGPAPLYFDRLPLPDLQFYDTYELFDVHSCPQDGAKPVGYDLLRPLFAPVTPGDPSNLGQYAPWFYINNTQIPTYVRKPD